MRENLEFYARIGYAGVFITNHFLDGNFAAKKDESMSYEDKIRFYCSDFEEGEKLAKEIGIDVFFGVEVINASLGELENSMAEKYAEAYGLCRTAGSDNHGAERAKRLAGVEFETPLRDVADFAARVRAGEGRLFTVDRTEEVAAAKGS